MSYSEREESLKCPRCGKQLDEEHIRTIGRGLLAVMVLGDHLRSIEKRDLYCVECFDETEKRNSSTMINNKEEYASPQSFELKKNIEEFKSGLVKKSKADVAGIESLYDAVGEPHELSADQIEQNLTAYCMRHLAKMLREDPEYRQGWQANIAMAFVDTVQCKMDSGEYGRAPMNWDAIKQFANEAADRFLRQLEIDQKTENQK